MYVNNINTINNMNNITISTLLSTHGPLIFKQDPTLNPSFPIYQMIQHITKKINNFQLMQKLDYSLAGFYKRI